MVAQEQVHEEKQDQASGESLAAPQISLEDYMEHYAAQHYEWVEGVLIPMTPATLKHNDLLYYFHTLLHTYFTLQTIGRVIGQPFVIRLPESPNRRREPDLLVVLASNPNTLTVTHMDGAPDICIEIVSEESTACDHGEKFAEYEAGGVSEYWIIDSVRHEARFYRLNAEKRYIRQNEDAAGNYTSPALPGLVLHVPTLWAEKLPDPIATVSAVKTMLEQ